MTEPSFEESIQRCYDELTDVFNQMKYSLTLDGGRKAFNLLLNSILDKYPEHVRVEACKLVITELKMKDI